MRPLSSLEHSRGEQPLPVHGAKRPVNCEVAVPNDIENKVRELSERVSTTSRPPLLGGARKLFSQCERPNENLTSESN